MMVAIISGFGKMPIPPDWIKISALNYMRRCITTMRKWQRNQKSKPEVNSRDVIKRIPGTWLRWSQGPQELSTYRSLF